jgi:hypothetical protein
MMIIEMVMVRYYVTLNMTSLTRDVDDEERRVKEGLV